MYGIYDDQYQGKFIVMEYMEGRSLDRFLHIKKDEISVEILLNFSLQIALGMDYLSSKSIIHRDLAARFNSNFILFFV